MKAWLVRKKDEFCATVVFAETRGKARALALLHLLRIAVLYATQIAGSGKTARLAQQNSFAMEQKKGARTMARYIDADKALEIFDEWIDTTGVLPKGTSYYYEAQGCIEDTPTEDVAPVVHGRWEKPTKLYPFWDWKCSECGCEEYRQADSKGQYRQMAYCPNCGAKMDEKGGT